MNFQDQSDPLQQLLRSLPPEQLAQLLKSGTLDQRDQATQTQLAQSHALRMNRQPAYGASAGMAQGADNLLNGVKDAMLLHKQEGQFDQRQSSLDALIAALRQKVSPLQAGAAGDAIPPVAPAFGP